MPLAAIVLGWLIGRGDWKYVAGAVGVGAFVILALEAPGPLAALLLLAVMNGIPFVDLTAHRLIGLKVQDAAVFGLAVLLLAHWDRHPSRERARLFRAAAIWSACFLGWWTYEFMRSHLLDGIPWLKAMLFGRDFLYFGILLPLALRTRIPVRSLRAGGLLLLAVMTAIALGRDLAGLTGVSVNWLVHPTNVQQTQGLPRLYSYTSLLVNSGFVFGVALLVSKESRGRRWLIGALLVVFFIDAALQLTRANYFALGAGLLVAIALGLYAARYGSAAKVVVQAATTVVVLIVVVLAIAVAGGGNLPIIHSVIERASSGVSTLFHSSGTVGYREQLDSTMLSLLGHKWPIGLGFLHPSVRYFSSLPYGSLRNVDTGVFNVLTTMGVVGAVLLYAPFLYGLRQLFRASRRALLSAAPVRPWIFWGAAAWIAWGLAGSPTLQLLFSTPGLVLSALTLGVIGHLIGARGPNPTVAKAPEPILRLAAERPLGHVVHGNPA